MWPPSVYKCVWGRLRRTQMQGDGETGDEEDGGAGNGRSLRRRRHQRRRWKVQGGEEEEMGEVGGGGAAARQPRAYLAQLLRHRGEGGAGLRRRLILPPRPHRQAQLPRRSIGDPHCGKPHAGADSECGL